MATTHPVVKLTYEDYRSAPGDERCELLDGDLVMVAAPNLKHQTVQLELATQLGQFHQGFTRWASCSSPPATSSSPTPTWSNRISCSSPANESTC